MTLDEQFIAYTRTQVSCVTGNSDWNYVKGEHVCEAAHVRRAGDSGTAIKAPFAVVPLTRKEHQMQSEKGQVYCLLKFLPHDESARLFRGLIPEMMEQVADDWFERRRDENIRGFLLHLHSRETRERRDVRRPKIRQPAEMRP